MNRLFTLALIWFTCQWAHAGGNTSVVEIHSVTSLKLEGDRIIIVGTGEVRFPVMTTEGHQSNSDTVLGQQVQWVYAKTSEGVFEVIPYFSNSSIEGVGTGGHPTKELKELSAKWWAETLDTFKRIKVGDRITIGYQGDQRVIAAYKVKSAVGWGSLAIHSEKKSAEQDTAGQPAPHPQSKSEGSGKPRSEAEGRSK